MSVNSDPVGVETNQKWPPLGVSDTELYQIKLEEFLDKGYGIQHLNRE